MAGHYFKVKTDRSINDSQFFGEVYLVNEDGTPWSPDNPADLAAMVVQPGPLKDALSGAYAEKTAPALDKLRAALSKSAAEPVRLAFTGSSTVQGYNSTAPENRFVNRLTASIQAAYPSGTGTEQPTLLPDGAFATANGVQSINFGIGGTTASYYMNEGDRAKMGSGGVAAVFHMVGSNDWKNQVNPATYKTYVLNSIADLQARITRPHIHVLVHAFRRGDVAGTTYQYEQYRDALREIATADPANVAFIDVAAVGDANNVSTTDALNLQDTDLIHPTDAGHRVIADAILSALGLRPPSSATAASGPTLPSHPLAVDYFGRADGALGTALSGSTWSAASGAWAIAGGKARATSGGTAIMDAGVSDNLYLSAGVIVNNEVASMGIIARAVGDTSRVGVFLEYNGSMKIWVKFGAVNTSVTDVTLNAYRPGELNILGLHLKGNVVTSYLNGIKGSSFTLSAGDMTGLNVAGNTNVGIRSGTSTVHAFDSIAVHAV